MVSASSSDALSKFIPPPVGGLPVDTRIQDYRIKGVVGEGGFAIVYLADDVLLHREVALKEYMPAALAVRNSGWGVEPRSASHHETFAKGMRSFINEARLLAQFKHPALVDVLRFWEENGTAYMAMPYYRGSTLRELFRQSGFHCDEPWLHRLIKPILSGLQAMHREKCFHRDISSDNIIVLGDGNPILLDFGAARRIVAEPDQLATIILKPGFAPIEQYSDDVTNAPQGPWTDIYALCAVCYLAISGRMPTTSVARIMRDPVVPLTSQDLPGFSTKFLAAIDKGLAVRPEDRPQTIAEFAALINQSGSAPLVNHIVSAGLLPGKPLMDTMDPVLRGRADTARSRPRPTDPNPVGYSPQGPKGVSDAEAIQVVPRAKITPRRRDTDHLPDDSLRGHSKPSVRTNDGPRKRWLLVGVVIAFGLLLLLTYWKRDSQSSARALKNEVPLQELSQIAEPVDTEKVALVAASTAETATSLQTGASVSPPAVANSPLPTSMGSPASVEPGTFTPASGTHESRPTSQAASGWKQAPSATDDAVRVDARLEAKQLNTIEVGSTNAVAGVTVGTESTVGPQAPSTSAERTSAVSRVEGKVGSAEQIGHRKGAVDLSIKPWGNVSVDGRSLGVAPPLRRISLPVGRHRLVVSHPNGASLVKEITVVESGVVEVAHDFASFPTGQH